MTQSTIDVTRLVDEQRISAFTIRLLVLSFVVMLTDGYDLLAASYGAPALIADWHVNPSDLGPMFSASPLGIVVGAPLLGWLGDRFGRRLTVILGTAIFGVFSLFCAAANSVNELTILRFCTGIGLGGMLPNITALNAEFAPLRARATLVVLMFMGVTAGSTLPALVVAAIPHYGWRILYLVGGVVPLAVVIVLYFLLPESIKFLSLRQDKVSRRRLENVVRELRPDLAITPETLFVSPEAKLRRAVPVAERGMAYRHASIDGTAFSRACGAPRHRHVGLSFSGEIVPGPFPRRSAQRCRCTNAGAASGICDLAMQPG